MTSYEVTVRVTAKHKLDAERIVRAGKKNMKVVRVKRAAPPGYVKEHNNEL